MAESRCSPSTPPTPPAPSSSPRHSPASPGAKSVGTSPLSSGSSSGRSHKSQKPTNARGLSNPPPPLYRRPILMQPGHDPSLLPPWKRAETEKWATAMVKEAREALPTRNRKKTKNKGATPDKREEEDVVGEWPPTRWYETVATLKPKGWTQATPGTNKMTRLIKTRYRADDVVANAPGSNTWPTLTFRFRRLFDALYLARMGGTDAKLRSDMFQVTFALAEETKKEVEWKEEESEEEPGEMKEDKAKRRQRNRDYFKSYGRVGIHGVMLQDKSRTEMYREAISKHYLIKDKIVLDVGSGTGILSIFAAKAGAKHVYAVECSARMCDVSRAIVAANGLEDKITVIRGKVEDIKLPVEKVDIIISEWMGYCLFYEGMLPSVLNARDRFLSRGGKMFPDLCRLYTAAFSNAEYYRQRLSWLPVTYTDVELSALRGVCCGDVLTSDVPAASVITSRECLCELDLERCLNGTGVGSASADFSLRVSKTAVVVGGGLVPIHGMVVFFEVEFRHSSARAKLVLSTAPSEKETHWNQGLLLFKQPVFLNPGDSLNGKMDIGPLPEQRRGIKIRVELDHPDHKGSQIYVLN